jgi:type 1 fimbria pilin
MRPRITAAVGIAVVSAVIAAPAFARHVPTPQITVTFTDRGCRLQIRSVSARNTTIVFHLVNETSGSAGIVIYSPNTKLVSTQSGPDLTVTFKGPGRYPYRCTRGIGGRSTTITRGTFTIRKS